MLTDEDEQLDYDFGELDELAHAYAVTIHRSQGSEYPAVVIPLTTQGPGKVAKCPSCLPSRSRYTTHELPMT